MFDEIINEARAKVSSLLQQQYGMGNEEADKTAETIGKSFIDIVQQKVQNKELDSIKEIFSGNVTAPDNAEVQKIVPQLAGNLIADSMDTDKANAISATVTPELFNMFNDKVAIAKQNGINIPALIEQFNKGGLGNIGSLMSMAGSFLKGGKSGMMADLLSKFSRK